MDRAMVVRRLEEHLGGFEGNREEFRRWSDLPVDVLNIIAERLDFIEQLCFRLVCKNWRQAQVVPLYKNLPWLMEHSWTYDDKNVYSVCSFHLPIVNQSHVTHNKLRREELNDLHGAVICASRFGWLLLQKSTLSFFYNPYSKSIIKLPDLDIGFNRCDRKWSSTVKFIGPKKAVEDVVYSNGSFYCVFSEGALGAFCVADSDWSLLTDVNLIPGEMFTSRAHMVESNGQLWLVCPSGSKCFKVFKFDWSEKTWDRMHALGCQALFLGCTSFSVSAEGETSGFAERIYYHRDPYSSYYSLETKQSYQCTVYPWVTKDRPERIWIQPPEI
ncbi:hypothetical protein CMV_006375 [Castanea mollissima]|uniref:F-box domain-containing protein n=1 Tax=Castanea mollissima TaxID=60419 RepID=A0A8J4RVM1_9ROSI|nr:hypothetical protein CMV_006375 [Castanea mollissima]